MAIAETDRLTCTRCAGRIAKGSKFRWYNRPRPKSPYHLDCKAAEGAVEEAEPEATTVEAEVTTVEAPKPPPLPSKPAPAPGSLDSIIRDIIRSEVGNLDPAALDARIRDAVNAVVTPVVKVEVTRPDGTVVTREGAHSMFARVARLVGAGFHVYLWGPAGSGKTTLAEQVAEAVNPAGFTLDTMDDGTFRSAVLGYMDAHGRYVSTPFMDGYTAGAVTIIDEFDLAPAPVQSLLNTALANGHCPSPAGLKARGKGHAFMGLGNSPMAPTVVYPERHKGSVSMMDRLYFVHVPLDEAIAARGCGVLPPKPAPVVQTTATAAEWYAWIMAVRAIAPKVAPAIAPFTGQRAILTGKALLALGESVADVADGLVFKGADAALVSKVLAACPLPGRVVEG